MHFMKLAYVVLMVPHLQQDQSALVLVKNVLQDLLPLVVPHVLNVRQELTKIRERVVPHAKLGLFQLKGPHNAPNVQMDILHQIKSPLNVKDVQQDFEKKIKSLVKLVMLDISQKQDPVNA